MENHQKNKDYMKIFLPKRLPKQHMMAINFIVTTEALYQLFGI